MSLTSSPLVAIGALLAAYVAERSDESIRSAVVKAIVTWLREVPHFLHDKLSVLLERR